MDMKNTEGAVMKRVALTLCIFIGNIPLALADDSAMAAALPATPHNIMGGVVRSISWADPVKGTKSEIVVIDAAKKPVHILVTSTTTLWDADAKAIMPEEIAVRKHVNVIYLTTDEGINIGESIKVLN
jgi:hypothetical protein